MMAFLYYAEIQAQPGPNIALGFQSCLVAGTDKVCSESGLRAVMRRRSTLKEIGKV